MDINYSGFYEMINRLSQDGLLTPAPDLYDLNNEAVFSAIMNRLAQPLPDGTDSPFSSRNPLSGHGQLVGALVYLQSIIGHEINLIPDRTWLILFQLLGIEVAYPEFPVVELTFYATSNAVISRTPVNIPVATQVQSRRHSNLAALTLQNAVIQGGDSSVTVNARINQAGTLLAEFDPIEMSVLPPLLSNIEAVRGTSIIYPGSKGESLYEVMLRARKQFQDGQSCITPRSFYNAALKAGATKVNVIPGLQLDNLGGYYSDAVTVVVYPTTMSDLVFQDLSTKVLMGDRLSVKPANIISIAGYLSIRVAAGISNAAAFNLVASAIQSNVNPPHGIWGDLDFENTLLTAIKNYSPSIFGVESIELIQENTGITLAKLTIHPWDLLQISSNISFNWVR